MKTDRLVLTGATVYTSPDEDPLRDCAVVIEDGKIAEVGGEIPKDFSRLDCSGCCITAGFWNCHVHFFERKWANAGEIPAEELTRQLGRTFTRYGFTSVFDLSSQWENTRRIRDRIESGEVAGPRIRSTGEGLLPVNPGIPPDPVLNFMGVTKTAMPEVGDAAQAAAVAKKHLEDGVDGIKLFASAPSKATIPQEAIEAAVNEAHYAGKPTFVHPNNGADVLAAVRGGVDVIAHTTPASGPWDEALLAAMKKRDVALTPTLTLWRYFLRHDRASMQQRMVETAVGQLRAWVKTGGAVLFGTDLGAVDPDPGVEYALMARAGMSFSQILASLTTEPLERFGNGDRFGRVLEEFDADLAVLRGDPASDLHALRRVAYTMRGGRIIFRDRR